MVVPSVAQQLAAIRHTVAKTLLPALPTDAGFEREQAGLVLAGLDWTMDVVASERRYEVVEHDDQRALLAALLEAGPGGAAAEEARAVLAAAGGDPPADLTALRERTRRLKLSAEAVFRALSAREDEAAVRARTLVTRAAVRQTERELAWARMTGFPRGARPVAEVLAEQEDDPGWLSRGTGTR